MNVEVLNGVFGQAVDDYYWLRNRQYPEQPALKLVGDRYRLSGDQRNILYRGITSKTIALRRKANLTGNEGVTNKILIIDGYNVLFTLLSYLRGRPVFIANDGLLRDAGGGYGKIDNPNKFQQAILLLIRFLAEQRDRELKVRDLTIILDKPVKNGVDHSRRIRKEMADVNLKGEVNLADCADDELKGWPERETNVILATSDSGIIDAAVGGTSCGIYDLARHLLETRFGKPGKEKELFPVICPTDLL